MGKETKKKKGKKAAWPGFVMLGAFVAGTDLLIKEWTVRTRKEGEEQPIAGGRLLYRRVHNPGFAMGRLKEYPALIRATSLAAGALLAVDGLRLAFLPGHRLEKAGLALMAGGAAGNGFDRLFRGYVVDYIGIPWKKESLRNITWNVADMALLAGGLLHTAGSLAEKTPQRKAIDI